MHCRYRPAPWRRTARRRAFSLVEIMVVLVIIGMLATLVTVSVRGYMVRARRSVATAQIRSLMEAVQNYELDQKRYPTTEEGLEALSEPIGDLPPVWEGQIPEDPWGNPYDYISDGRQFEIISYGADGIEGGSGADADIVSSDLAGKKE